MTVSPSPPYRLPPPSHWRLHRCLVWIWLSLSLLTPQRSALGGVLLDVPNSRVTDAALGRFGDAEKPDLAVLGNEIYATWLDDRDGNQGSVFFARSVDGGLSWGNNIGVSSLPYDDWCENPQISVQPDGTLWIVWYLFYTEESTIANDLRIARSTDQGRTWERFTLKDGTGHEDLWKTRIASDENQVYVVFHDYRSTELDDGYNIVLYTIDSRSLQIRETQVNDVPRTGRITDQLLDDGPRFDLAMRTTDNGSLLCVAWEDQRDRSSIFCTCSTNQGASFLPSVGLTGPDLIAPQIALAPNGTLYATYSVETDFRNNIVLRYSKDLGRTWTPAQPLTRLEIGSVTSWDLAISESGHLVMPWVENFSGESNLNLSTTRGDGANLITRLDIEDDQGRFPTVSSQGGVDVTLARGFGTEERVFLAWGDDRNTQDEIWSTGALLDSASPSAPSALTATAADTAIVLSWSPSSDANGISGYQVFRANAPEGPFIERSLTRILSTSYTDVGLNAGERYYYRIVAVDGTGNESTPSIVASSAAHITSLNPSGLLVYERGETIQIRQLDAVGETSLINAYGPVLSNDGSRLYSRNEDTISVRSITPSGALGQTELFLTREGLLDFDIAADNTHFALIAQRTQFNTGSGVCLVFEPIHATLSQDLYTDDYNYSSYVSISANGRWMAYRYDGFCNAVGFGTSHPGDLCVLNLETQERHCIEGADVNGSDFAPASADIVMAAAIGGQRELWRARITEEGKLVDYIQLTRGPANQPVDNPRWSTDGKWIVFQRDINPDLAETAEDWRLFAVRSDGTSLRGLGIAGTQPGLIGGGGPSGTNWTVAARRIQSIALAGDSLRLTFSAEAGARVLETSVGLVAPAAWIPLTPIPAKTTAEQADTIITLKLSDLQGGKLTPGFLRIGPLGAP